jgi:hypothetical protein
MLRALIVAAGLVIAGPAFAQVVTSPPEGTEPGAGDAFKWQQNVPGQQTIVDSLQRQHRATVDSTGHLSVDNPPMEVLGGATAFSVGSTSAPLLPADPYGRRLLSIHNESGSASVAVCISASCTAALNTAGNYTLGPGQTILWNTPNAVPSSAVNAIATGSSIPVTVEVH